MQSDEGIPNILIWSVNCKIRHTNTRTVNSKGDVVFKNLDLNTATDQQVTVIFGEDLAKKIVDYRNQNGPRLKVGTI